MSKSKLDRYADVFDCAPLEVSVAADEETVAWAAGMRKRRAQRERAALREAHKAQSLMAQPLPPGVKRASNGVTIAVSAAVDLQASSKREIAAT